MTRADNLTGRADQKRPADCGRSVRLISSLDKWLVTFRVGNKRSLRGLFVHMMNFLYFGNIDWSFHTIIQNYLVVGTFALLSVFFL